MDKSQVSKSFAWNVLFTVLSRVLLPVVVGIALSRILGPARVGTFAALIAFISIIDLLRDFGIGQNFITDPDPADKVESKYFGLSLLINLTIALLLAALYVPIAHLLKLQGYEGTVLAMALAAIGSGLGIIPGAKLQRSARFRDHGLIDFVSQLLGASISLSLAVSGHGVWSLVWGQVVRAWSVGLGYWAASRPRMGLPTIEFVRTQGAKFLASLSNSFMSTAYTIGDTILAKRLFGDVAAGHYATAFSVAMKPVELVSWPLGRTLLVAFADHQNDKTKLADIYGRAIAAVLMVTTPLYLITGAFGNEVVMLLYGNAFRPAGYLLSVFSLYLLSRGIGTVSGALLVAIRRPGLSNYGWIFAIIGVAIALSLGPSAATLETFTITFTAGALVAFGWTVGIVLWMLRPSASQLRPIARVLGGNCILLAWISATIFMPFDAWIRMAMAILVGYPIYACIMARTFGSGFLDWLSISGLKRIWAGL